VLENLCDRGIRQLQIDSQGVFPGVSHPRRLFVASSMPKEGSRETPQREEEIISADKGVADGCEG
jgi:hypothetical protein